MTRASLQSIADKQVLYMTTIGRTTGLPREIEIWFVVYRERFYLFAETGEAAGWVKNLRRNPKVTVRIGEQRIDTTARVLDGHADRVHPPDVRATLESTSDLSRRMENPTDAAACMVESHRPDRVAR